MRETGDQTMLYIPCGDGATKSRTATLFPNEAAGGGIKHKFHSERKEGKKAEAPSSLVPDQEGEGRKDGKWKKEREEWEMEGGRREAEMGDGRGKKQEVVKVGGGGSQE